MSEPKSIKDYELSAPPRWSLRKWVESILDIDGVIDPGSLISSEVIEKQGELIERE